MNWQRAREQLLELLSPMYGRGEAESMLRILAEDVFDRYRRQSEQPMEASDAREFTRIYQALEQGQPLQYVLGVADFFGLKWQVGPGVLIPRQETEELVAWVLDDLKERAQPAVRLLDVGAGSGCIGLTLQYKRRDLALWSVDVSPAALEIARENATRLLGTHSVTFIQMDVLEPAQWSALPETLDVVVSNPPYIPRQEAALMPEHVRAHEPDLALFVPDDQPFVFYDAIARLALQRLALDGVLYFECNEFNAEKLRDRMRDFGFLFVELRKDLSGAWRMLRCSK
jgi:release factor glutamine methyltransferase